MMRVAPKKFSKRMVYTAPDEPLAPTTPKSSTMATWSICDIHSKQLPITESVRLDGLSEKVKVEIIPATEQTKKGSRFPHSNGHSTITTSTRGRRKAYWRESPPCYSVEGYTPGVIENVVNKLNLRQSYEQDPWRPAMYTEIQGTSAMHNKWTET